MTALKLWRMVGVSPTGFGGFIRVDTVPFNLNVPVRVFALGIGLASRSWNVPSISFLVTCLALNADVELLRVGATKSSRISCHKAMESRKAKLTYGRLLRLLFFRRRHERKLKERLFSQGACLCTIRQCNEFNYSTASLAPNRPNRGHGV